MLRVSSAIKAIATKSGVDRKRLEQRRLEISDARKHLQESLRELEKTGEWAEIWEVVGVVAYAVSMPCDILIDAVAGTQTAVKPIGKVYKIGTKDKYKGNKYEGEIKNIDRAKDAVKSVLPPGSKFMADVFAGMAKNTVGMIGFAQDSAETKQIVRQLIQNVSRQLRAMEIQLKMIEQELGGATGGT